MLSFIDFINCSIFSNSCWRFVNYCSAWGGVPNGWTWETVVSWSRVWWANVMVWLHVWRVTWSVHCWCVMSWCSCSPFLRSQFHVSFHFSFSLFLVNTDLSISCLLFSLEFCNLSLSLESSHFKLFLVISHLSFSL